MRVVQVDHLLERARPPAHQPIPGPTNLPPSLSPSRVREAVRMMRSEKVCIRSTTPLSPHLEK